MAAPARPDEARRLQFQLNRLHQHESSDSSSESEVSVSEESEHDESEHDESENGDSGVDADNTSDDDSDGELKVCFKYFYFIK